MTKVTKTTVNSGAASGQAPTPALLSERKKEKRNLMSGEDTQSLLALENL